MSQQQPTTSNPEERSNPFNPTTTTTAPGPAQSAPDLHLNLDQTGLATRRAVLGSNHVDRSINNTNAFTAPMQEMITSWAWGDVWNRPGLDRKQRSLMNIGLLIALNRQLELGMHVRGAIRNGLSELEIREAVMHATVYCGAPAGMEGMRTVDTTLEEMEKNGEMRTLK
ncbi:AhpD-like protein [Aspergillus undulatus]|uniref:AhpD-like protein n=1 Tax=Aspergillus undulatus TaxID=1810928 RepID=UPI003CCDD7FD